MANAAADKTERATPKRRAQARRQGQVARSMEFNSVLVLTAGLLGTVFLLPHLGGGLSRIAIYFFEGVDTISVETLSEGGRIWILLAQTGLPILLPVLGLVLVVGVGAAIYQVGLSWSWTALAFRFEKLNPIEGLKQRFFSWNQLFELAKNLLKVATLGVVAWFSLRGRIDELEHLMLLAPLPAWKLLVGIILDVVLRMLAVLFVLALADLWWQRWRYEESLKMTKQEVKQEGKDADGDPQIKARLRSMMLEILRSRMLADTRKADVVVTNPTHLSVAIRYAPGAPAPKVVAKGKGFLALRIREVAREARVPVIEDKPLARALYQGTKVGDFIPTKLFEAVAKVLAAVYRASGRARRQVA